MRAKKTVCFFSALLLLSMLICSVDASSDTTISFRGGGVTIELIYPEEAHPEESIWHNITLTSTVLTTLRNFTVVIKTPVNSSLVEIFNSQDTFIKEFSKSSPLTYNLSLSLPQEANGALQCFLFVNTSSIDDLSTKFYTTLVSDPTFSEMKVLYAEMSANYTNLKAEYNAKVNEYNELAYNYTILYDNYTTLLGEYNTLYGQYNNTDSAYKAKIDDYNELSEEYTTVYTNYTSKITELRDLQRNYEDLNITTNELQANITKLQTSYDALNENYTILQTDFDKLQQDFNVSQGKYNSELGVDKIVMLIFIIAVAVLIVFIFYIKRKEKNPYLVIRKETVSMKSDEET